MKKKITKHAGGRPTVFTKTVTAKLLQAFKYGCNITTACQHAGISTDAFEDKVKADDSFAAKIVAAQQYPRLLAGQTVILSIADKNHPDVASARWWLEKKHADEFGGAPLPPAQVLNIFSFSKEQQVTFNTQFREFLRGQQYA